MTPLDLIEQSLSAAGCNPRRRDDTLSARCPAHPDRTPSLSVSIGSKRDVVICCHAGCDADAVMAALDLRWSDLPRTNGSSPSSVMEQVATYDYHDAAGELAYQVVRYQPKTFRQRRPDGHGGWIWNVKGVAPVLYRLPEVLSAVAAGETVYVVEGEKDANNLARVGEVCATTSHGGAGKFGVDHASALAGADVVIVADKDTAGRAHAETVASALALVGAQWSVVETAEGKDVTDHLRAGHTVSELVPVDITAATETTPTDHPLAPFLIDWPEFWSNDTPQEWLMEPLFAAGRAHAIYAGAKTGKSYLVLAACAALATGRAFLGHPGGDPIDVLYVDLEMTADDIRDRLEEFGYGPDDDLSHLHYALLPLLPPLDTVDGGQALTESAVAVGAKLVVIDTTARSIGGTENDSDTLRAFARCTGIPLKQAGIAYARLDHAGKDATKGQRGTSAKNDDVDVVLRLERIEGGVKLTATHRRMSWYPETTSVHIGEDNGTTTFGVDAAGWPAGTAETADLLDDLGVPTDASGNTACKALKEAGNGRRRALVLAAQRWRGERDTDPFEGLMKPGTSAGTTIPDPSRDRAGNHPANPMKTKAELGGDHWVPLSESGGNQVPPPRGGLGTQTTPDPIDTDTDTYLF